MSVKTQARAALQLANELTARTRGQEVSTFQSGTATLVGGTATLGFGAGINLTANSRILLSRRAQGGVVTNTVQYEAPLASRVFGPIGTGQFVINASLAAGGLNAADTSVIDWMIID
jgi:hypothetical protein